MFCSIPPPPDGPLKVDEYFLDNSVGRPDPRTFSGPRFYSEVLLEVVALVEP